MTNQSPAEALRQQFWKILQGYVDVYDDKQMAAYEKREAELMELVTAYAATVEREGRKQALTDVYHQLPTYEMIWKQLNANRLRQELADINRYLEKELGINQPRLAALQGPIQGDAPDHSEVA